ncbi:outer membrane protein [Methylocystis heyeri]|uniref:Outer membrane beta-barrel protein n=1 Tax=Methylocystis heyeri TaxID=391905 RepID=A0A6B8KK32_9HYPH|nr:outer membrane beta-barrel protein [Methylocystis heyeri]QGM46953.1 outer membrane beta-barrel protein [Methylocystis heyeri]
MGNSKALFLAAAVASGASFAANAADLLPPPPPIDMPPPPEYGGWYLRGDAGVGAVQMSGWRSTLQAYDETGQSLAASGNYIAPAFASIGDQGFVDIGFGYQFNSWFRADITGEYRTEASYRAGIVGANAFSGWVGGDYYNAGVSTALFMANGYVDIGTWHGVTPFVGFGVGIADNRISGLVDTGFGVAADKTQANFAWAVMAGLALNVTPNFKVELGYRYLDMGSLTSNPISCISPTGCWRETHSFHLASNDLRLGFRYAFNEPPMPVRPLITKY